MFVGDCIDCYQCFYVCLIGVDIWKGVQFDCIQCGLCIDVCDNIMIKIGKLIGLIVYDIDENIECCIEGKELVYEIVCMWIVVYVGIIVIVGVIMLVILLNWDFVDFSVLYDCNLVFVEQLDGFVCNGYIVCLFNKCLYDWYFVFYVEGMFVNMVVEVVGVMEMFVECLVIQVGFDIICEVCVLVMLLFWEKMLVFMFVIFCIIESVMGEVVMV